MTVWVWCKGVRKRRWGRRRRWVNPPVQTIAALRERLEHRLISLVATGQPEMPAQFVDAPRQRIVGHDGTRPHLSQQVLAKDNLPGTLRKHNEHIHYLGIEGLAAAGPGQAARARVDLELLHAKTTPERTIRVIFGRRVHLQTDIRTISGFYQAADASARQPFAAQGLFPVNQTLEQSRLARGTSMVDQDYNDETPRRWSPFRQPMSGFRSFHSLVLLACGSSVAAPAAPVLWEPAAGGNGHLYEVIWVGRQLHWEEARQAAKDIGPGWDLATIATAGESAFVKSLFGTDPRFFNLFPVGPVPRNGPWIGAFNTIDRDTFQWVSGDPVSFTDWGPFFFYGGRPVSYADFSPPWGDGSGIAWSTPRFAFDFNSPIAYVAELSTPSLAGLVLGQSTVAGCRSVTGTITIPQPAPPQGVTVNLSDTLDSARTPATLTIPAGATRGTFTIKTSPVKSSETGTVRATFGSTTLNKQLTVRRMALLRLSLSPPTVVGVIKVIGKAKLECVAAPESITVDLRSNRPDMASPVAMNIVIPQGLQSGTFDVTTHPVDQRTWVSITATANDIAKSTTLRLDPAASVSPRSLKFGTVLSGARSPVLAVTLYNKGMTSFSVTGIGFTGSGARNFLRTHNCPVQLAPGSSCTIGVGMWAIAVGAISATLNIGTSATPSPLTVHVSGTAI